jgi:aspartyl-tRNA(Asn)/glutamyl-tRNA(Gln) amidotransferase subunit C
LRQLFLREMQRIFSTSTMSLTRQDVEKIAHLARLAITDQEMPVYVGSLSAIVNFVDELSKAQTDRVEPMAHPLEGQHQRLRADVVTETDHHEQYQSNAPAVASGLYVVPRVIE